MKKLFLIDAYALIFRFYYAFIGRPMRNADGVNTSAVFGFVRYINEIIRRENPHYLGVAFDPPGGNFRHELFADYKANRGETPEDIIVSVPYIKEFLEAMRIPVIEVPGYEADDVIGTLSREAAEAGFEVFMVTPDKDYGQLIRPNVYIYKQRKGGNEGVEIIGCEQVCEHYGIDDPKQVIDILALWGDASDNIPGVPGIGEKSAVKLICQYGTVENLLDNTEKLSQTAGEYRTIARTNPAGQTAGNHRTARSGGFRTRKNGHGIAGRRPSGRGFPGTGVSLAAAGNAARTSRRRHSDGRQTRAAQIRRFAFRTPDDRGSEPVLGARTNGRREFRTGRPVRRKHLRNDRHRRAHLP
ncbi:MAG: 5'-3' exonuclease H3TH domain-containing protein, partial [Alistipes sp.]